MTIIEEILAEARQHIEGDPVWVVDEDDRPLDRVSRFVIHGEELVRAHVADMASALAVLSELSDVWPTPRDFEDWLEVRSYTDDWVRLIAIFAHQVMIEAFVHEVRDAPDVGYRHTPGRCAYCEEDTRFTVPIACTSK
jgi:hypothetical protein